MVGTEIRVYGITTPYQENLITLNNPAFYGISIIEGDSFFWKVYLCTTYTAMIV